MHLQAMVVKVYFFFFPVSLCCKWKFILGQQQGSGAAATSMDVPPLGAALSIYTQIGRALVLPFRAVALPGVLIPPARQAGNLGRSAPLLEGELSTRLLSSHATLSSNRESSASSFVSSQSAAGAVTSPLLPCGILRNVAPCEIYVAVGKGTGRRVDRRCKERGGGTEDKWSFVKTKELQVTVFYLVAVECTGCCSHPDVAAQLLRYLLAFLTSGPVLHTDPPLLPTKENLSLISHLCVGVPHG